MQPIETEEILAEDFGNGLLFDICSFFLFKPCEETMSDVLRRYTFACDAFEDIKKNFRRSTGDEDYRIYTFLKLVSCYRQICDAETFNSGLKSGFYARRMSDITDYICSSFLLDTGEKLFVVALTPEGRGYCVYSGYYGTHSSCYIAESAVLSVIKQYQGCGFVLVHTHPDGRAVPSASDMLSYGRIKNILEYSGMHFIDCVIVGLLDGSIACCGGKRNWQYYSENDLISLYCKR